MKCPRCGSAFEPKMATQSFCSPRCRVQANAIRQQRRRVVGFMVQLAAPLQVLPMQIRNLIYWSGVMVIVIWMCAAWLVVSALAWMTGERQ